VKSGKTTEEERWVERSTDPLSWLRTQLNEADPDLDDGVEESHRTL
jgi:hypothetical protein